MRLSHLAVIAACGLAAAGGGRAGEFRVGAHAGYLNPKANEFDNQIGFGGSVKYKFTETMGIEIGGDFFQWKVDELVTMPYSVPDPEVSYDETDKVYPLYFTALFFSPVLESLRARAYLGLGGGYYYIDSKIDGSVNISDGTTTYPTAITGDIKGKASFHIAGGADFELSPYIYLNTEFRYVVTKIERSMTFSNDETGSVTVEDEEDFWNWQFRIGLEYEF